MKFEIEIRQKGKYGRETLRGEVNSYMAAEQLVEMIMAGFKETEIKIMARSSNKTEQEDE